MRAIGIAIPFIRRRSGAAIDAQAQAHFDRVIADGGLVPSGLSGVNAFFTTIKTIYATSDITTAISVGLDAQVLGYKLGAGAGTTAGQAAQKLYSCSGASGDVVQTTAASQPLLLVHSGANYWFGSGVSNNFVSTPNAAANQITGDIEIIAKVSFLDNTSVGVIINKAEGPAGGNAFAYSLIQNGNNITFEYSNTGTTGVRTTCTSTATISSIGYTYGQDIYIKVNRSSSTGDVKIYTSFNGLAYTQLGATISTPANAIANINQPVTLGNLGNAARFFLGKIYRATISNTIDGAPVVDFNPNQYNASTSQTQWTSSTGEIWSIQTGTAATGYKGVLVDRTIVQGDGIDDRLTQSSNVLLFINATNYAAFRIFETSTPNKSVVSLGNNPNEIDHKQNSNNIQSVLMFAPALNLRFAAMQRNETSLQGIANVNNGATITNTITASGTNLNKVYLFASPYIQCANGIVNTEIVTSNLDNLTIRSAMYNYIRTINNSAF